MSTMVGYRGTSRVRTRVAGKAITTSVTTLLNLDNPQVFRELQRHSSIASSAIQVVAPFFQNDDGVVKQGGKVTNRATTLVLDISAVYGVRANGAAVSHVADTVTLAAADATNPRIDTVALNTSSPDIVKIDGTPTAGATLFNLSGKAAVPANRIVLAYVLVPATATTLTAASIADARP